MLLAERMVRFVACRRCSGSKRETCPSCRGYGFQTRNTTRTRYDGHVEYGSEQVACGPCFGVGYILCTLCGGRGQVIR
jgi:DnaJ-class molecular chaperone